LSDSGSGAALEARGQAEPANYRRVCSKIGNPRLLRHRSGRHRTVTTPGSDLGAPATARAGAGEPYSPGGVEVSVIIPCLDEAGTIRAVIADAAAAMTTLGYAGEILVIDAGSTDGSPQLARTAGARVIETKVRGYGAACLRGFDEARGEFLVLLDADGTYSCDTLHRFVEPLRAGLDVVVGTRRNGEIRPRAMSASHRLFWEPLQTFLLRRRFGVQASDVRCGMRGITRAAARSLALQANGMELSTEMLVRATQAGMQLTDVPVTFHPRKGRRSRRRVRDSWRVIGKALLMSPMQRFNRAGLARTAAPTPRRHDLPLRLTAVVVTKDGGMQLTHLARHLARQRERYGIDVLVVDSGSTDETTTCARENGFTLHTIDPREYGHGRTRNLGARLAESDVVCFLSQDVLPCTPDWPAVFARHFADDERVAGVCGRQVPRSASTAEMWFVSLNYPATPCRFDPVPGGHVPVLGHVVFSNAFAAVRRSTLLEIPYVDDVPSAEDHVWAKMVTARGWSIVYEPRAEALHAHRYTLRELYRRNYLNAQGGEAFGLLRKTTFRAGLAHFAREIAYFVRHGHAHWLPWLVCYEFVRWWGWQSGRRNGWRPAA
jgi:glycosyltransferase involved in cell wall biosynthesis